MAILPTNFLNAVVAIGIDLPNKSDKHWIGSGFIVGRKEIDNPQFSTYYIITNKHVIKNQKSIYVRFNFPGENLVKDYSISLYDAEGNELFSAHGNETTDIVAIQIAPQTLIDDRSIWGSFDLEDNTLTLEQMQKTGVEEGCLVYALGFPMNLVGVLKTPICRLGCISRIGDAFMLRKSTPTFLVDAQTFPGNSGGPIVSRPEILAVSGTPNNSNVNLIGILSAYIPYEDTLVSLQTQQPVMIQRENSGLTIVHPVDRIKEVVELEWGRVKNRMFNLKYEVVIDEPKEESNTEQNKEKQEDKK